MDVTIYARLSQRGEDSDLERQLRLCRRRAANEGWPIAREHVDNGVSGWRRGAKRQDYEEMLGQLDGSAEVLAYNADRLFRQDRERLRFFDKYTSAGLTVVRFVDGMDADLASADGRKFFRDLGSAAEHQSDRASERIRRKMEELSQEGRRWGGRRPFGYTRDMDLDAVEADAIRRGADAVLGGRSAYHVARMWNDAGLTGTGGARWGERQVVRTLSAALIAGVREHRRENRVLGKYPGTWPAVVTVEEHELLRSLLATKRPRQLLPRRHPLSGILRCGLCGKGLRGTTIKDGKRVYTCMQPEGCGRMSVVANGVEDAVLDAVQRLDPAYRRKHSLDGAAPGLNTSALTMLAKIAEQRMALTVADGLGADVSAAVARLEDEERALRETARPLNSLPRDPEQDEPDRRDRRHRGELTESEVLQSRDWVAAWVDNVVITPAARPSNRFDPSRVHIKWREG